MTIAGLVFLAIACFAFVAIVVEVVKYVATALRSRGEVAAAPELPPCGMRLVLTEEQVEQSFAEIEKNFSVTQRRNG